MVDETWGLGLVSSVILILTRYRLPVMDHDDTINRVLDHWRSQSVYRWLFYVSHGYSSLADLCKYSYIHPSHSGSLFVSISSTTIVLSQF